MLASLRRAMLGERTHRAAELAFHKANADRLAAALRSANERTDARLDRLAASLQVVTAGLEQEATVREADARRARDVAQADGNRAETEARERWEGVQASMSNAAEGAARQAEATRALAERIEFVRQELMFEFRYGGRQLTGDPKAEPEPPRVLDQDKVDRALAEGARVNLGCGHIALEGFLNVDSRALPGVDVAADVKTLPFEVGTLREVFSAHLLEHFPAEQLRRELLPYWVSLLRPGGTFRAVVPDADAMARRYAEGSYGFGDFREVTYGAQDYDGDFHFNMFSPDSLAELLREGGLDEPRVLARGRENGRCFECEVEARKPA